MVHSAPNSGTFIKELRIQSRAIFVLDPDNKVRHAEYVKEVADFRITKPHSRPPEALGPPRLKRARFS